MLLIFLPTQMLAKYHWRYSLGRGPTSKYRKDWYIVKRRQQPRKWRILARWHRSHSQRCLAPLGRIAHHPRDSQKRRLYPLLRPKPVIYASALTSNELRSINQIGSSTPSVGLFFLNSFEIRKAMQQEMWTRGTFKRHWGCVPTLKYNWRYLFPERKTRSYG